MKLQIKQKSKKLDLNERVKALRAKLAAKK